MLLYIACLYVILIIYVYHVLFYIAHKYAKSSVRLRSAIIRVHVITFAGVESDCFLKFISSC